MPSPRDALRVGRTPLHSVRAGHPHPRSIGRSRMFVCSPPKYWGAHDARPESSYPIPPTKTRAGRRGAPALNTRRSLSFARLSPPPSSTRVEQNLTSLPRLNKGGNEKIVANKRISSENGEGDLRACTLGHRPRSTRAALFFAPGHKCHRRAMRFA